MAWMFISAPGSNSPCCAIKEHRGRNPPAEKFTADVLIGRHSFHGRIVLVGAHEVTAIGAGGAQYGVDTSTKIRRASFSRLGSPACGACSASTSGAIPLMKSCAINPVAKPSGRLSRPVRT